ncbi:MAG TPA: phytanoyl-CoA dioxygenase family protein, partial [Acidimicrobiia bacterium]|nr:phytanoyl-CoA dioxygenase family protein [Acidimicrobiia bacterium]
MQPSEVLAYEPRVLTQQQREFYFQNGYLLVEAVVPPEWLDRLRAATEEMVDRSRALTRSDRIFDLERGHSADEPRLRRLTSPVDHHPEYWAFASEAGSVLPEIMADLVGPDVKFHHSKLNFKVAHGGEEVKWHQDIQFFPHTNYSVMTIGTYLHDCGSDQGPLGVLPGSHEGPLYDQYNKRREWVGCLSDEDVAQLDLAKAVYL